MFGMRVAKTPVVIDIPEASVDAIDGGKGDEGSVRSGTLIVAVNAQARIEHDGSEVLAAIEQMWKLVPRVGITTYTLQGAPCTRECSQEAYNTKIRRIARSGVVPTSRVQTEEGCNVLDLISKSETSRDVVLTPMVYVNEQNMSPR
jgi:hypothetical protein